MADKYYVGDVGTDVIVDCGQAITGATNTKLLVKKPNGTEVEWKPAEIYQANYLKYTIVADDFNEAGSYTLQVFMTLGGWSGHGESVTFTVYSAYK